MSKSILTADQLREVLSYDPETGIFTSRRKRNAGTRLGWINNSGYQSLKIDSQTFISHRVAWLYVYGDWPRHVIDHIDGNKTNNRIVNLRDVLQKTNLQNKLRASTGSASGLMGAHKITGRAGFRAAIRVLGKNKNLGHFITAEDAHQAYMAAKRLHHSGCTI